MSLLKAEDLNVEIAGKTICKDLAISFNRGECWGVLGSNGIGKTTLLHTLAGLRKPNQGFVYLEDRSIGSMPYRQVAQTLGVLLQDSLDPFPTTVLETALIGRHPFLSAWQWESEADVAMAKQALELVGLQGMEQRQVGTLSGGERRRLGIASVLTQSPIAYLLDEPTNHLDLHHQFSLLALLKKRCREDNVLVLTIMHDINIAAKYCDHLIMIFGEGELKYGSSDQLLNADYLSQLYQHTIKEFRDGEHKMFLPI